MTKSELSPDFRAPVDANWAFQRYEDIRARLPQADFPDSSDRVENLGAIAGRFDAFLFDSFGVLNVGETPIETAVARIAVLRSAGKHVLVLTNAATPPLATLPDKYAKFGFDFDGTEIVSSRDVLRLALKGYDTDIVWGIVAPEISKPEDLGVRYCHLSATESIPDSVDGIVFLSSQDLDRRLLEKCAERLEKHPCPLLVGNPDLVAPRETGFSQEPGAFAHELADRMGVEPIFFGKPYANAFEAAFARLPAGIRSDRVAMVGDTLHTDILGGAAAGCKTVLVTAHGVLKDMDVAACVDASGIVPDFIAPRI